MDEPELSIQLDYAMTEEGSDEKTTGTFMLQIGRDLKELEMAGLRSAVRGLTAVSFTGEQPTQKEEISLTIYLDNENDPEVSIQLYRHDGDRCIAVVDGKATAFVERARVVDLIEAVQGIVLE